MRRRLRSQRGVSLVELLVAVGILAVALVPLLRLFLFALRTAEHSNKKMIAMNLARDLQEEIRSKEFADPIYTGLNGALGATGGPTTVGLETNDTYTAIKSRQYLDDVDDYDGWCRGQDCDCSDATAPQNTDGRCIKGAPLEAFNGDKYRGNAYPHYFGFTRQVRVYNIYRDVTDRLGTGDPQEHKVWIGVGTERNDKNFQFFNLQDANFRNLTGSPPGQTGGARGRTPLKVIEVTVKYKGPVTPEITITDEALIALPISRQQF